MAHRRSPVDIFISHSHQDAVIAEALTDLLRSGLAVPDEKIRCTSLDLYRLPAGALVDEQLRHEIAKAKIFIGIVTSASVESAYVSFEMGARWGARQFLAPVLVSSGDQNLLKGPLARLNAVSCDSVPQVERLLSEVAQNLERTLAPKSRYQGCLQRLVDLSAVLRSESVSGALRRELNDLYEVLARALTVAENAHLQTLALRHPPEYLMHPPLRQELARLEHLGVVEALLDRSLASVVDGSMFTLRDSLRLTDVGRRYLRWLAESAG